MAHISYATQLEYDVMDRAMGNGYKISGGRGARPHQVAAEAAARRQEAYYAWRYGHRAPSKTVVKAKPKAQSVEEFDASFDQKENKNQQQTPKSSETSDKPSKLMQEKINTTDLSEFADENW
jgi:hypothetical protein